MTHIFQLVKKSVLVRIFLVVVLSLAVAWVLGSGLRTPATATGTDFDQAPVVAKSTSGTSGQVKLEPAAAQPAVANVKATSLDKAVRMLGGVDRDKGSASAAKTNDKPTSGGTIDSNQTAKNSNAPTNTNQKTSANSTSAQVQPGK